MGNILPKENLLDFLKDKKHLFNMTGITHGKSVATTLNTYRPSLQSYDPAKRLKNNQGQAIAASQPNPPKTNLSQHTFFIREWKENEFFDFLKEADGYISELEKIELSDTEQTHFEEILLMRSKSVDNEYVIHNLLDERFKFIFAKLGNVKFKKGMNESALFPGSDRQIDFSVHRKSLANVGIEVKVPWNFPGGKDTSGDSDPGRIGRDVSLVDVIDMKHVDSLADYREEKGNKGRDTNRNDGSLSQGVEEDEREDEEHVRRSPRIRNMARVNYKEGTAGNVARETDAKKRASQSQNKTYTMKEDCFPPRQLVSYMLSCGMPYALLTTGYRIDFCKLDVSTTDGTDVVTLYVAGPFWTVGKLNDHIERLLQNEGDIPLPKDELKTSDIHLEDYYWKTGVQKFGKTERMCFSPLGDQRDENKPIDWSTNIGEYTCFEGILRFLLASTATTFKIGTDGQIEEGAKYSLSLPQWYLQYTGTRGNSPSSGDGREDDGGDNETQGGTQGGNDSEETDASDRNNCAGDNALLQMTDFGRLYLSDFHDPIRYKDHIQYPQRLDGDATLVGFGRNGPAFRKTINKTDLVCKQVANVGGTLEELEDRLLNLEQEVRCYKKMESIEGTVVPKFLFAGPLVDTNFWIFPDQGHVFGLATTWQGDSLDTEQGARNVIKLAGKSGSEVVPFLENALLEAVEKIHKCGILQNDIELKNVVCNDKNIAFVDFDDSEIYEYDDFDAAEITLRREDEKEKITYLVHEFWSEWSWLKKQ